MIWRKSPDKPGAEEPESRRVIEPAMTYFSSAEYTIWPVNQPVLLTLPVRVAVLSGWLNDPNICPCSSMVKVSVPLWP